ncbi:hypothetical protein B0H10DRAFT_2438373, partial [Mycena sp. CBHHK59/15]
MSLTLLLKALGASLSYLELRPKSSISNDDAFHVPPERSFRQLTLAHSTRLYHLKLVCNRVGLQLDTPCATDVFPSLIETISSPEIHHIELVISFTDIAAFPWSALDR